MKKLKVYSVLETGRFKIRRDGRLIHDHGCHHFIIPDGVREIGESCFEHEIVLSLSIPDSVVKIGGYSLSFYAGRTVRLPDHLEEIGDDAFFGSKLEQIIIPKSVKHIGQKAFAFCDRLKRVIFEDDVDTDSPSRVRIDDRAFHWCASLEEVILPSAILEIGEQAFQGCSSLVKVNIPPDACIGRDAFWDYWRQKGYCGHCGAPVIRDLCQNPTCIANKEETK